MTVSRRLRFEILRRDNYSCRYCGATAPEAVLTVDHVIPVTLGGGDEPRNLATACIKCNSGKSSIQPDSPIVDDVDATAILFAAAMEEVARRRQAETAIVDAAVAYVDEAWTRWKHADGSLVGRPSDWAISVKRMFGAGLNASFMVTAVNETMARAGVQDCFRYFAGICWREISTRQELARRLIEDGEV